MTTVSSARFRPTVGASLGMTLGPGFSEEVFNSDINYMPGIMASKMARSSDRARSHERNLLINKETIWKISEICSDWPTKPT
jgi:hypothetical protein